jgi:hypothetical protein
LASEGRILSEERREEEEAGAEEDRKGGRDSEGVVRAAQADMLT